MMLRDSEDGLEAEFDGLKNLVSGNYKGLLGVGFKMNLTLNSLRK